MRCKLLAAILVLCCSYSWAQNLEVLNPPSIGNPGFNDLYNHILNQSHANGITTFIQWGPIDNLATGPCSESTCNWGPTDQKLRAFIAGVTPGLGLQPGQKLNLIISIIPESFGVRNTSGIPAYVFNPTSYTSNNWCPGCAPQDMATCGTWPGGSGAPTCATGGPGNSCAAPLNGVWNAFSCRLTGGVGNCPGPNNADISGYPVLYEKPLMTAYQDFVKTVLNHYANGGGHDIGAFIGYIRVGLANGGENLPYCTVQANGNGTSTGIWPSPEGLNYDLNPANNVSPDWYITNSNCTGDADCQGKFAYIAGNPAGSPHDGPGYVAAMYSSFRQSLQNSGASWKLMGNAHAGPPNNGDSDYAFREAPVILGVAGPPCGGNCSFTGFGQESLSEYDLHYNPSNPQQFPCNDLWCYLFGLYQPEEPPTSTCKPQSPILL